MRRFSSNMMHDWWHMKEKDNTSEHSFRTICYQGSDNHSISGIKNGMRLSVLICTIPEREDEFEKLWSHMLRQWHGLPYAIAKRIEIIAVSDERRMTIGAKRNLLLDYSYGDYVCFIDDDDWVSEMYLTRLWIGSLQDPDCIGFSIKCENYPTPGKSKLADVGYGKAWRETTDRIYRPPYHKTPVRASIAKDARFPDKSFGEDAEYSSRIMNKVKEVHFIPEVLYTYNAPVKPQRNRYRQYS